MFITEYDEQRAFAETKAEGWIEGREEGREEGRAEGGMAMLVRLVKDGLLTVTQAADKVNMTVPEFEAAMHAI